MEFLVKCGRCQKTTGCFQHDMFWHCGGRQPICQTHCLKFLKGVRTDEQLCRECRLEQRETVVALVL